MSSRTDEAMAHEVKNLLHVIGRVSDVLLSRKDLESSTRRDVEQIRVATERAEQLTRRLFEFSTRPAQPTTVDVNALVCRLEPVLNRLLGQDVDLSLRLEKALGPVHVDPIQLEQVLLTLVLTAREAIPDQGQIEISTRRVLVEETPSLHPSARPYVALSVHDNGQGIGDETSLSLVRSLVGEAGGKLRTSSRPGIGTTVELRLPELGLNGRG